MLLMQACVADTAAAQGEGQAATPKGSAGWEAVGAGAGLLASAVVAGGVLAVGVARCESGNSELCGLAVAL